MKNFLGIACLFLFCAFLCAQDDKTLNDSQHPLEPTITFDRYWEAATPQEFTITVRSSGVARYLSRNPTRIEKGAQEAEPDYTLDFTMSGPSRDRIFTLAQQTSYFHGDFDYKHKVADTGKKTLTYADPVRSFQTTYNFSDNKNIDAVTKLFLGISNTIEHGRKLEFMHRYNKLDLDDELKAMEEMAAGGYLAEVQIITPALESIANDSSVLHMARQRAERLLALAGSPGSH
jgi:hypothetical protein